MNYKILLGYNTDVLGYRYPVSIPINTGQDNGSILIVGEPGTGKTFANILLATELATQGATVLMIDIGNNLDTSLYGHGPIPNDLIHKIDTRGMIPKEIFYPITFLDDSVERKSGIASRVAKSLTTTFRCNVDLLRIAIKKALETGDLMDSGPSAIKEELNNLKDKSVNTIKYHLYDILDADEFSDGCFPLIPGKINILEFNSIYSDEKTKTIILECLLSYLWYFYTQKRKNSLFIMIDEFQTFKYTDNSFITKILSEGRKYGIYTVLSSQTIDLSSKFGEKLCLSGHYLIFRPSAAYCLKYGKMIDPIKAKQYAELIKGLDTAECLVIGKKLIEDQETNNDPLKIKINKKIF